MPLLFKTTKALERQIDQYLDAVSQGGIVFKEGLKNYLDNNQDSFSQRMETIDRLEAEADNLRRNIETDLYSHSLIPEHRGDVLGLLETMDNVIDTEKETLNQFSVENPFIPPILNVEFADLAEMATQAAESVVQATRSFFMDFRAVKDHLHKVYFYEKEADKLGNHLKRHIFQMQEIDLSQKIHLRYFALHVDSLADRAENVADRLAIYTIKRMI
ncbi:MAG: DUF47 domain-containing protein [Calditrichaceae bacterium]